MITLRKSSADRAYSLSLLFPTIVLVGVFILYPILDSIIKSLMDFGIKNLASGSGGTWNNFENYKWLFKSGDLWPAVSVTMIFMILVVGLQFCISLLLAVALNSKIRGQRFLRSIIMLPWLVPTIISALIWMWIFQPQYGLFNYFLYLINGGKVVDFALLSNPAWALLGVSTAALWKQIPLMTLLLLAGLQNVPEEMYEAADMDGATKLQQFLAITVPFLRNVIRTTVLMSIIENFKQFPLFWVMTGGGPMNKTTTLAILSYKQAFINMNMGRGAAVTTVWLVLLLFIILVYSKAFKTEQME